MFRVDLSVLDYLVKQPLDVRTQNEGRGCVRQSHIPMNVERCRRHAMYRRAVSEDGQGHRRRR